MYIFIYMCILLLFTSPILHLMLHTIQLKLQDVQAQIDKITQIISNKTKMYSRFQLLTSENDIVDNLKIGQVVNILQSKQQIILEQVEQYNHLTNELRLQKNILLKLQNCQDIQITQQTDKIKQIINPIKERIRNQLQFINQLDWNTYNSLIKKIIHHFNNNSTAQYSPNEENDVHFEGELFTQYKVELQNQKYDLNKVIQFSQFNVIFDDNYQSKIEPMENVFQFMFQNLQNLLIFDIENNQIFILEIINNNYTVFKDQHLKEQQRFIYQLSLEQNVQSLYQTKKFKKTQKFFSNQGNDTQYLDLTQQESSLLQDINTKFILNLFQYYEQLCYQYNQILDIIGCNAQVLIANENYDLNRLTFQELFNKIYTILFNIFEIDANCEQYLQFKVTQLQNNIKSIQININNLTEQIQQQIENLTMCCDFLTNQGIFEYN